MIAAVAAVGVGATTAFFSDTETSSGNVIAAGSLDLKVNNVDDPVEAIVNLPDLKPSQHFVTGPITLTVNNNPGKLYKHIVNDDPNDLISCSSNGVTEPECKGQGGVWNNDACTFPNGPSQDDNDLPKVTWFDLELWKGPLVKPASSDPGDNPMCDSEHTQNCWNILIDDNTIELGRIASHWIYLGTYGQPLSNNNHVTIRQSFHMKESAENAYQSDKCVFKEQFKVVQTNAPHPENCVNVAGTQEGQSCPSFFDVFTDLD